jgi:glycosyltransferase involved in cell wall biosynthesis
MSLGVAIPTYSKHYPFLQSLLENIASSTVKPDMISVSCSSMIQNDEVHTNVRGVPVVISYSMRSFNPSQNRNRAISKLSTDFVSLIDGDDLMHPQRIEYVKNTLLQNPEIAGVYHSYKHSLLANRNDPFELLNPPMFLTDVQLSPSGLGLYVPNGSGGTYDLHHAHGTFRRSILQQFPFDERPEYKYAEDSVHATVLGRNGVKLGYLANPLTRYMVGTR